MESTKRLSPVLAAIIVVALIGAITVGIMLLTNNDDASNPAVTQSPQTTTNQEPQPSTTPTGQYEDGVYTATGTYATPGGNESIDVAVTLENGEITDTSLTEKGMTGEAQEYQGRFAANYKELIVGKSIDEVSLSRVAGSSLTSNGFNDALDQIKDDARA